MNDSGNRWRLIAVFTAVLAAVVIIGLAISNLSKAPMPSENAVPAPSATPPQPQETSAEPSPAPPQVAPAEQAPATATAPTAAAPLQQKLTLAQIAAPRRKSWQIAYPQYIGLPAADFKAKTLDGNDIRLSDYKGRDVLLVFWATWCGPCREEIPSLIKLRNSMPADKLAIIAISTDQASDDPIANNTMMPQLVAGLKRFAAENKMNYTVVTMPSHLDRPFIEVNVLPTAFFISPDGNIKFATQGIVPLKDIVAILAADK